LLKRLRYVSLFALMLASIGVAQPDVAPPPKPKAMFVTDENGKPIGRVVEDREELRFKSVKTKFASAPTDIAAPPAEFDFTSGGKWVNNVLGNNRWGDCFYVAPAHQSQCWCGMNGNPFVFSESALVARYRTLSPRDTGLGDDDVIPEWKAGIVGPNGPHKILDVALVDPSDWASVKSACYRLGGVLTTHRLRTTWESGIKNGMIWDKTGSIDPRAGHAVHQGGAKTVAGKEVLLTSTWGLQVYLTKDGLANSDAEVLASVSKEWFNERGYTPVGDHYNDVAKYWLAATGRKLPQGLFPDPGPPPPTPNPNPPPGPPPPSPIAGDVVIDPVAKTVTVPAGWKVVGGGAIPLPPSAGTSIGHKFVMDRAAKKLARKDGAGLIVSDAELAAAKAKIEKALAAAETSPDQLLKDAGAPIGAGGDKIAGPLTDLLDWITSHEAEIEKVIAIILKLVALFGI
jgi:hypothetical protein